MPLAETAIRLDDRTLLLVGKVKFALTPQSTIRLGMHAIQKPYEGLVFDAPEDKYYAIMLTDEVFAQAAHLHHLNVTTPGAKEWIFPDLPISTLTPEVLASWPAEVRRSVFRYCAIELAQRTESLVHSPYYSHALGQLMDVLPARVTLNYAAWLAPHLVYLHGSVQGDWPEPLTNLLLVSDAGMHCAEVETFQIAPSEFAAIAVFDQAVCPEGYHPFKMSLMNSHAPLAVHGVLADKAFGLEFIHYLNARQDFQKHLIRERVSQAVRERSDRAFLDTVRALLKKLQLFVQVEAVSLVDARMPFNIHFEHVIPIDSEGLFVSGWLRDPCQLLDDVEAVSALGFALSLRKHIYRVRRDDVRKEFLNSPFGNVDEDQGFFAYVPFSEEIRKNIQELGELYSFRFRIKLQGDVQLDITPTIQQRDHFAARDFLMKSIPSELVSDAMLTDCIGPAAAALQKLCMQQVEVRQTHVFGQLPEKPLVSLIIPLYKRIDFIKVHFASMANDPQMADCELIYVLDSPEQEAQVLSMLGELSVLYALPAKLVVMRRNAGYAAATNTGTMHARGRYLVLMNSDVFPASQGWAHAMVSFMMGKKHIGILAPKLIYEDDAIQHAGMFFAKTTYPFWLNLHYYKGYPADHPEAAISRAVPAVTGACMMIERALYEKLGRMTTDYVIGDFEDSDLCMKCQSLGLENWYYSGTALYHLERQSVPLHQGYHGSLAWRYNAMLHDQRWGKAIAATMERFAIRPAEQPRAVLRAGQQGGAA